MLRLSEKKALKFLKGKKPKRAGKNKYGAKKTEVDGIIFDSKREAARYDYLKRRLQLKEIFDLHLQPTYQITIDGIKICKVKLDFGYMEVKTRDFCVEDVKGMDNRLSQLKRKLVEAQHKIKVRIIK